MRVLLVAAVLNSGVRYTTANLLAAMGQVKYNMIISGVGIIMQVVLDIFLIPHMGVMAVAISNCLVFIVMSIFLIVVFYRKYYRS
jgi:O-antigen/teichoic acid export membrane protein